MELYRILAEGVAIEWREQAVESIVTMVLIVMRARIFALTKNFSDPGANS
jgi:hypothetical protein